VRRRHEDEVGEYTQFVEYLEPGSLKEKLQSSIKKIERETKRLGQPVD